MHPRLFTVPAFDLFGSSHGPYSLHTYGVLLAVAFLLALWLASVRARQAGLDAQRVTDLGVWALLAGLAGAKLLLLAVDWRYYSSNPRELLSIFQSGGVFYGGLVAGSIAAVIYLRRHALPGWLTADVLAPAVLLGQAVGRLGCLAAGCCWGRATQLPWAVTYTDIYANRQVGTPMDVALHPTQIYESILASLLLVFLLWLTPRKRFHGQVLVTYVALYSTLRFGLEYFRGDAARGTLFGGVLSTSQFIALVLLAAVAFLTPYLFRTQRVSAATAPAAPTTEA